MLENYKIDKFGVIHQINIEKFNYDIDYNNNYNKLGELGLRMSHLRLGYLIGSLGFIPNSILDIGVGNGDFIKTSSNIIENCYINDITKIEIKNTTWVDDINIEVDIITMFDVLEHLNDMTIISNFNCKYLLISLPNCEFGENDDWFYNWKHRKPNEHLHHFNKKSFIKYIESMGYKNVNITNIEDTIRKNNESYDNIITGLFKKI